MTGAQIVMWIRVHPSNMVSKSRLLGAVLGLVVASMVVHYVLFGSLPLGKPTFLGGDDDEIDEESFDDVTVSNSDAA